MALYTNQENYNNTDYNNVDNQNHDTAALLPHLLSFEKMLKLPVVEAAWHQSQDVYERVKGRFCGFFLYFAYNSVSSTGAKKGTFLGNKSAKMSPLWRVISTFPGVLLSNANFSNEIIKNLRKNGAHSKSNR